MSRTITTSAGTTVRFEERNGNTMVILDHSDAPDHMRNLEAGRIHEGGFQPAIFAAWKARPETLRAIADLIEEETQPKPDHRCEEWQQIRTSGGTYCVVCEEDK